MPRPLQHVHDQQRRIGELHEEDLVARDPHDAGRIVAQRERVKAVEYQAEVRMVRSVDDRPRLAITIGDAGPTQAPRIQCADYVSRPARQAHGAVRPHVLRRAATSGRRVRAHQHQLRTHRLHHVELALGALEVALEDGVRRSLEVAKRLVQLARETEIGGDCTSVGRRAVEVDEVRLEDLEAVEARRRDRLQLLPQRAAHRNGGDRLRMALPYLCLNSGFCLLTKACMPIFWSSVANSEWKRRRSKWTPSDSELS